MPSNLLSDHFEELNDIKLHYIEYPGKGDSLICLHGLTANAHAFDGLVAKGLSPEYHLIAPDLRGRGLSDHPAFGYGMEEHAQDILRLLDHLEIGQASIMGHSFGGFLGIYLAANYPERVQKLILLDAGVAMNPRAAEMLGPTLARLEKHYPSWDAYLEEIKSAPFMQPWNESMLSYYRADVMGTEDGGVTPRSNLANIFEASMGLKDIPWEVYLSRIAQPVLLINALEAYTLGEPLLPDFKARETEELMQHCTRVPVDGNHHTMLYGHAAEQVLKALRDFPD